MLRQSLKTPESGRDREVVGLLDVGDDIGGLPQRVGRDRPQADGPVALGCPGHADDVELHVTAQRMPLERIGDPGPDLLDARRSFCEKRFEIHVASPSTPVRGWPLPKALDTIVGARWLMAR